MKSSSPSFSACYHTDSSTKAIMFYLVPSRGDEAWSLQLNTLYQQSGFKCADFHISWQNSNDVGRLMFYLKNRWKYNCSLSTLCHERAIFLEVHLCFLISNRNQCPMLTAICLQTTRLFVHLSIYRTPAALKCPEKLHRLPFQIFLL